MNDEQQVHGGMIPRATIREAFAAKWQEKLGDDGVDLVRDLHLIADTLLVEQEEMITGDVEVSDEFFLSVTEIAIQENDQELKALFRQLSQLESGEPASGASIVRRSVALAREQIHLANLADHARQKIETGESQLGDGSTT